MSLSGVVASIGGVLVLTCALLWNLYQRADERADRAEAALKVEKANETVITKYVERVTKVPGPTVIRERLVAGVCDGQPGVPGAGRSDAAAGADPGVGPADIARDIGAAQRNRAKLEALQEVLRGQVK